MNELDCYNAITLKQQSAVRHVTTSRHIILISSDAVCTFKCHVVSGEAVSTNFIVFEPTIYRTLGEHTNRNTNLIPVIINFNFIHYI
jgi:hypothetical protein